MPDPTTDDVLEPEFDEGLPHSRTEHGGMPRQSDEQLEAAVERDRVAAGIADYAPADVPPATDPPPEDAADVVDRAQRGLLGDTSAERSNVSSPEVELNAETYGTLTVEDEGAETVEPADVAGTARDDDADVGYAPRAGERGQKGEPAPAPTESDEQSEDLREEDPRRADEDPLPDAQLTDPNSTPQGPPG